MHVRGFTLIELLMVVAILSATAVAAFNFATEDRSQVRIDDTVNRLAILRRAIVGADGPVYDAEQRLAGYVVDNGVLPASLAQLTTVPAGYAARGSATPYYSSVLDSTCVQGAATTALSSNAAVLIKGHAGSYLRGRADNTEFRDGWGNRALVNDSDNFGWSVDETSISNAIIITSLGADNEVGGGTPAAADIRTSVVANDWLVSLDGWSVTVTNRTSGSVATADLQAALLVFENSASGGRWTRFTSPRPSTCAATLATGESCALTFGATSTCGTANPDNLIPIGRHLVVLLDGSNSHYVYGATASSTAGVVAQAAFYANAGRPAVALEIR